MRNLKIVGVLMLLALAIILTPKVSKAEPMQGWYTATAYSVGFSHWGGGSPHYAAFFSGDYGYNQHFVGPGGDAATASYSGGIANWDWYPPFYSRLLVPKTWLLFGIGANTPSNYQAVVFH